MLFTNFSFDIFEIYDDDWWELYNNRYQDCIINEVKINYFLNDNGLDILYGIKKNKIYIFVPDFLEKEEIEMKNIIYEYLMNKKPSYDFY